MRGLGAHLLPLLAVLLFVGALVGCARTAPLLKAAQDVRTDRQAEWTPPKELHCHWVFFGGSVFYVPEALAHQASDRGIPVEDQDPAFGWVSAAN